MKLRREPCGCSIPLSIKTFCYAYYLFIKFYFCFTIMFIISSFKESIRFLTALSWLFGLNLILLLEYKFSHDLLE